MILKWGVQEGGAHLRGVDERRDGGEEESLKKGGPLR